MYRLFYNCKSLISIDLSNFDTSNVWKMVSMFSGCESLKSLDLSSFKTPKVRNVNNMFSNCNSLIESNLSNFINPPLNDIANIFMNNYNLKYLDISHFDTSRVTDMTGSFKNCYLLKMINISNFNTSITEKMEEMFYNCHSLEYLDLSNFDTYKVTNMKKMFYNCSNLKYINLKISKGSNLQEFSDIFKTTPDNMIFCINETLNQKLYNIIKYNKTNSIINCSYSLDFFYFSEETIPSTNFIATTEISTTSNIIRSNSLGIETKTYLKEIIEESTIQPIKYKCVFNNSINSCSFNNMENIKDNKELYDLIINNLLQIYSGEDELNQIIEGKDNIIYQLTNGINQLNLLKNLSLNNNNLSIIDLGECENIIRKEYNINENDSLIILKQENISKIKSSEKNVQFEIYEPYNKTKINLSLCEGTKINLYTKMILSENTKAIYDQLKALGYDMFNINDKFYQDICTPYKSQNSTDVLLSDRIDYIYNNDDTQCQSNCEFSGYFLESQYMSCSCSINEDTQENKKEKFSPKKLYESFYDVLKYSNYKIYKCYNLVFIKKVFETNIGGIIIFSFYLIELACFVLFLIKKENSLKNEIINLNIDINNNENKDNKDNDIIINQIILTKNNPKNLFPPRKAKKRLSFNKNSKTLFKNKNRKDSSKYNYKYKTAKIEVKSELGKLNNNFMSDINSKEKSNILVHSKEKLDNDNLNKEIINDLNIKEKIKEKVEEKQELNNLSDFELNELDYEEAVKLDKRTFIQIYFAKLKREHIILFTFFSYKDYNLWYIKIARFIFLLATDISMNVFFFSDDSMHKLFLNYGKYDFIQQIPQIVYSTIISQILEVFLCFLSMTDKYIYKIKNKKLNSKAIINIFKCINIKLIFFFIFTFIMLAFDWYTVASFCGVYENSQITFIKDSFFSFALGIVYTFVIYLITSGFRTCAIKKEKKGLKCIYKLSEIIPFF